jgi:hypothetical protein
MLSVAEPQALHPCTAEKAYKIRGAIFSRNLLYFSAVVNIAAVLIGLLSLIEGEYDSSRYSFSYLWSFLGFTLGIAQPKLFVRSPEGFYTVAFSGQKQLFPTSGIAQIQVVERRDFLGRVLPGRCYIALVRKNPPRLSCRVRWLVELEDPQSFIADNGLHAPASTQIVIEPVAVPDVDAKETTVNNV